MTCSLLEKRSGEEVEQTDGLNICTQAGLPEKIRLVDDGSADAVINMDRDEAGVDISP